MTVARTDIKHNNVNVVEIGDVSYVQIWLNERNYVDDSGEQESAGYEYDFNEFAARSDEIDMQDVMSNPAKYLDYKPDEVKPLSEQMSDLYQKQEETSQAVQDLLMMMEE